MGAVPNTERVTMGDMQDNERNDAPPRKRGPYVVDRTEYRITFTAPVPEERARLWCWLSAVEPCVFYYGVRFLW